MTRPSSPTQALIETVKAGNFEAFQTALQKGDSNLDYVDPVTYSNLFHYAAESGNLKICELLARMGIIFTIQDSLMRTPLEIAAERNHKDVCLFFLQKNVITSTVDFNGNSALSHAASNGNFKLCQELLKSGAATIINTPIRENLETPLHLAVKNGLKCNDNPKQQEYLEICRLLISHGADCESRNIDKKTPFDLANRSIFAQIVKPHPYLHASNSTSATSASPLQRATLQYNM